MPDDFPDECQEMWGAVAKALMIRLGGVVDLTGDELRAADDATVEMSLGQDDLRIRIVYG